MAQRWKLRRFADPVRQATPILRYQSLGQCQIAQRHCQKDVRFRAAFQQESRYVQRLADTPLCRG